MYTHPVTEVSKCGEKYRIGKKYSSSSTRHHGNCEEYVILRGNFSRWQGTTAGSLNLKTIMASSKKLSRGL